MNAWITACLQFSFGLASLVVGGELLVRSASRLAKAARISPLVVGLTIVAFGTSSPELAVSVQAAMAGNADIALGNVVGSNIFNILFILGISALVVPLVVSDDLVRADVPLMIVASLAMLLLGWDGRIGRFDGLLLCSALAAYTWRCFRQSRPELSDVRTGSTREPHTPRRSHMLVLAQLGLIAVSLFLLGLGSHWLVGGSVFVATRFGVGELVIGLTIVAAGTSLPEVVTSIMAAWRGEREIAVGNIVGSNIFNILGVLGLASVVSPSGIPISAAAFELDIPVMVAVSIACLPIFFTGNVIERWEGGLFFGYYVAYTTYLLMAATQASVTRSFGTIIIVFIMPLTAITLLIGLFRAVRKAADS